MTTFTPQTADELRDAVAWAVSEEAPVEILGHGTKRGIGRPLQTEHAIDLSQLSGVTLYEPEELVLSAKAGTPVAEIEGLLAEHRQELAFEPLDYRPLLGIGQDGPGGTIGGVLAANLSGPRRIKAGAARDHILGIEAVSGRGESFKSGGRVVKNVTGYDLSKAMAGSWGTLAAVSCSPSRSCPPPRPRRRWCCTASGTSRQSRPWRPPWARVPRSPAPRICPIRWRRRRSTARLQVGLRRFCASRASDPPSTIASVI